MRAGGLVVHDACICTVSRVCVHVARASVSMVWQCRADACMYGVCAYKHMACA